MNLNRVVILLVIFGALYYGYPKYQDKKVTEQIRTGLKTHINNNSLTGEIPPEMAQHLNASMSNNYPNLNFKLRFKQFNKTDFNEQIIKDMESAAFIGTCGGFYKDFAQTEVNDYSREMLAKVVKEDKISIHYEVKDKMDKKVFEFSRPLSECPNFDTLEAGGIPHIPASIR